MTKKATLVRKLSELRSYWIYLSSKGVVRGEVSPFDKLSIPSPSRKATSEDRRTAFDPADLVKLHKRAEAEGDGQLADLIFLAMYTGARREELCSLKTAHVKAGSFQIVSAKTGAGEREVPIHPKLKPVFNRLTKNSIDGYVLSGLRPNKYGSRGDMLGKRFRRLKDRMGFTSNALVFHSIRRTVVTLLERAGVREGVTADIVGHEKGTITYGLYSGGSSLEEKARAIKKIAYPHRR